MTTQNLEIKLNETFTLELDSNPSTGYSWNWINKQSVSLIENLSNTFSEPLPERIGGEGKEIWEFKAIKPGVETLKFEYLRIWDPNSVIESQEFKITIL